MNSRFKLLLVFCFFVSLVWIVYLFILQLFDPFDLTGVRQRRYDHHKEFIIADRGNIYDTKGTLLVSSLKFYQIDIDLNRIRSMAERNDVSETVYFHQIADIISENSNLSHSHVYNRLINARGNTAVISENIDENQLLLIRQAFMENRLNVLTSAFSSVRRIHTRGNLAARLIGVTRGVTDNTTRFNRNTFRLEGLNGVERAFNNDLLGDYGWRKTLYDARQRVVPIPNTDSKPVSHGSSIYLTIDADIQEILENNLQRGLTQYRAKNAIGVIMNPRNGNILAMSGLNENDRMQSENHVRSLQNMPIQFLFEPGSTMKPFVSLMALERGLYNENDLIDCRTWRINMGRTTRTIRDSQGRNMGMIPLRDVIVQSSNVGIARVADRVGAEYLYRGYLNLGFGTVTNVDLTDESSGLYAKLSDWSRFSLHSLSFGQEMSVTALQLATAYSAMANGGHVLRPNIVDRKIDSNGNVYFQSERRVVNTVSNPEAIAINNSFMLDSIERGTGSNTRFRNIKIAGKTGTSEKAVGGRYSSYQYIASFAGFFPYENPEYVMVIIYDEPEHRFRFGSQSAVPTFRHIVEEMLTLPDNKTIYDMKLASQEILTMPRLIGHNIEEAKNVLIENGIDFQVYNEANDFFVVQQFPQAGVQFGSRNRISIYCSPTMETVQNSTLQEISESTMPSFVGMSLRQAINLSKALRLELSIEGSGHIVSQSIRAGEQIRLQQRINVVAR
ncbi:MAG: penicillin-binding transpeptidase domain-containing protein [Candidatus Cloacimonetes bacterium]|nr:penicillin-binding transpeptidase domain-containing protein [Candidatus Cloacimonadota bacterium]